MQTPSIQNDCVAAQQAADGPAHNQPAVAAARSCARNMLNTAQSCTCAAPSTTALLQQHLAAAQGIERLPAAAACTLQTCGIGTHPSLQRHLAWLQYAQKASWSFAAVTKQLLVRANGSKPTAALHTLQQPMCAYVCPHKERAAAGLVGYTAANRHNFCTPHRMHNLTHST